MKTLIFSDIHGRKKVANRIKEIIEEEKPDHLFFLGDFLYNGPRNGVPADYDGMAVATILKPYLKKALCVKGNCDAAIDDTVLGLVLPRRAEIIVAKKHCVLAHGDDTLPSFLNLQSGDIFFSGHTHVYKLEKKDGILYVNPGSVSFPKEGQLPSYAIFEEKSIAIRSLSDSSTLISIAL